MRDFKTQYIDRPNPINGNIESMNYIHIKRLGFFYTYISKSKKKN